MISANNNKPQGRRPRLSLRADAQNRSITGSASADALCEAERAVAYCSQLNQRERQPTACRMLMLSLLLSRGR